jgi:hypothetical protein
MNILDILSGFSDCVNIDIILKVDLEPFKFKLAASRPRFRVLQKWINFGFSFVRGLTRHWDRH